MRMIVAATLTWIFIVGLVLLPLACLSRLSSRAHVLLMAAVALCLGAGSALVLLTGTGRDRG